VIAVVLMDESLILKLKFPFVIAVTRVSFTSVTLGLVAFVESNSRTESTTMEPLLWRSIMLKHRQIINKELNN